MTMYKIGVQTKNVVTDEYPEEGFALLKRMGFSCADFSLNGYLLNTDLYQARKNLFFDRTEQELEIFFTPHKKGAEAAGIEINQMHMPYPTFVPNGSRELNEYLWDVVAPKSMKVCAFFACKNIVVHGFKLARYLGSEDAEWEETERFLDSLAPMARELGITICIENLYDGVGGHLIEGPGCDAAKAAERIDRMNEKYQAEVLGFCFDTGHANIAGLDFECFLGTLGPRLKALHIHDNDGSRDLHQIPFTFARTRENMTSTDWDGLIRGLKAAGFEGVYSFETAPVLTAFPPQLKRDALGLIHQIGEYFAKSVQAI